MDRVIESGTLWLLRVYDVGDTLDLDKAREVFATRGARRGGVMLRGPEKGPGGVLLATPPLDLDAGTTDVAGASVRTTVRLFDFGTLSVRFEVALEPGVTPEELARLAAGIETSSTADEAARALAARLCKELGGALVNPRAPGLFEDYTVFSVARVRGCDTAQQALEAIDPARLLLAEPARRLAPEVVASFHKRAIQYYAEDAVVIGWNAALVVDPDGGRDVLEVLEIASARLLELRYYDALLKRELSALYDAAQAARRGSALVRSPFGAVARRAATLFVEMTDLYDRLQGVLALVGDAHMARLYSEAAERFRLDEISAAVREKLSTLASVSELLQGEVDHRRAMLLEVAVIVLIVVEVVIGVVRH